MTEASRTEYLRRINRAQDYIERHLTETICLEDVAKAAHFSPYHFHRVFSAFTGETLNRFIVRLRIERAASLLLRTPYKSITEIALDGGFSSSATFARAFRAEYQLSASDFRARAVATGPGMMAVVSKNCKTLRKDGKAEEDDCRDNGLVDPITRSIRNLIMPVAAAHVAVENQEAFTVAYVRHVGPYAGDPELFGRLFAKLAAWAGPRGLMGPGAKALSIYHDDPDITEAAKLRTSCCITVPSGTLVDGEVGLMQIDAGKYARAHFEILPQDYGGAWQWFMAEWIPRSGYQPADGPCYELYLNDCKTHPEGKHIVELTMPVKPL